MERWGRAPGRPADFHFAPGPAYFATLHAMRTCSPFFLSMFLCILDSLFIALASCLLWRPGCPMPSLSLTPNLEALFNWTGWSCLRKTVQNTP